MIFISSNNSGSDCMYCGCLQIHVARCSIMTKKLIYCKKEYGTDRLQMHFDLSSDTCQ